MKKLGLFILLGIIFLPALCSAKSFEISQLKTDCVIRQDGKVDWKEANTFQFEGSYSSGSMSLLYANGSYLDNIKFGENGIPYQFSDTKEKNTYFFYSGLLYFFYLAQDEAKTFEISYTIHESIDANADYCQFNWPLHVKTWNDPIETFTATFRFEIPIPKDEILVWLHGPDGAKLTIVDEKTITAELTNVDPNAIIDIRLLIPSHYFTIAKSDQLIGPTIQQEEEKRAEMVRKEYEKQYKNWKYKKYRDWILGLVLAFMGLFLLCYVIYVMFRYGLEYRLHRTIPSIKQPLDTLPPGETAYLMKFYKYPILSIQAIIMDLIRRKFIKMLNIPDESSKQNEVHLFPDKTGNHEMLSDYEKTLIDEILFPSEHVTSESGLSVSKLRKNLHDHPKYFMQSVKKMKTQLTKTVAKYSFFDLYHQKIAEWIISACMIVLALLIWVYCIYPRRYIFAVPIFIVIFELIGWMNLSRRTKEGAQVFKQYLLFRKFLKNPKEIHKREQEDETETTWEKYLVYSVALEANKKMIPELSSYLNLMENIDSNLLIQLGKDWTSSFQAIMSFTYTIASTISRYPSMWISFKEKVSSSKFFSRLFINPHNKKNQEPSDSRALLEQKQEGGSENE